MRYPVIVLIVRPATVVVGAVHDRAIEPLDMAAPMPFGAAVWPNGQVTTFVDHCPAPDAVLARTRKTYSVPLVRPVTLYDVVPAGTITPVAGNVGALTLAVAAHWTS
jgi:hypothetical protein